MKIMFSLLLVLFATTTWAQNAQTLLKEGVDAHRFFRLAEAEEKLEKVLTQKSELKPLEYGEALYFYSLTLLKSIEVKAKESQEILVQIPFQMRIYKCHEHYLRLENAKIARWSAKSNEDMARLNVTVLRGAMESYNQFLKNPNNQNLSLTEGYLSLANTIEPEHYVPFEIWGNLRLKQERHQEAINYFGLCIEKYKTYHRNIIDNIRIPEVYLRLSNILQSQTNMLDSAKSLINEGLNFLSLEMQSINNQTAKYGAQERRGAKLVFNSLREQMRLSQMQLVSLSPNPTEAEEHLFIYHADTFAQNNVYHFIYAIHLSKKDAYKSIEHLDKAIALNDSYLPAYLFKGSILKEMGEIATKKAQLTGSNADLSQAFNFMQNAYKTFTQAYNLEPNNRSTIEELIAIGKLIGELEDVKRYEKELSNLAP